MIPALSHTDMRQHPEITSKRRIAKEVGVDKGTVGRYYDEVMKSDIK